MRILYLSPTEPYPGTHAGFTHVHNLLKNLCEEGVEVTLITGAPQKDNVPVNGREGGGGSQGVVAFEKTGMKGVGGHQGDITKGSGMEIEMDIPGLTIHHITSSGPFSRNLRVYRKIMSLVKENHFDLIHERYEMAGGAGMMASWRKRIPLVLEVNDPLLELNARPGVRSLLGALKRRQFSHARAIICQTPHIKQAIWDASPRHRVFVIPNGADPSQFPITPFPEEKRIGFMGSFMPWHGVEILLTAFSGVLREEPDSRLLLIGDHREHQSRLESQMKELGITDHATFTGPVPQEEVPRLLSSCMVLTAPFAPELDDARRVQYRKFGFWWSPLKIFEYMASGRPVVTPDLGMIPNYLGVRNNIGAGNGVVESGNAWNDSRNGDSAGGCGLIYPQGDVQKLTEHLITLLRDRELARKLGEEGRKRVEDHFNWRTIAHITRMAYVSVLERNHRSIE